MALDKDDELYEWLKSRSDAGDATTELAGYGQAAMKLASLGQGAPQDTKFFDDMAKRGDARSNDFSEFLQKRASAKPEAQSFSLHQDLLNPKTKNILKSDKSGKMYDTGTGEEVVNAMKRPAEETPGAGDSRTASMRDFRKGSDITKNSMALEQSYSGIEAAASDPTPANQMALTYQVIKMLDPGSTVNRGEHAEVGKTTNAPGWIANYYNQLVDGGTLNDKQIDELVASAQGKLKGQRLLQKSFDDQIIKSASAHKIAPQDIIFNVEAPMAYKPRFKGEQVTGQTNQTGKKPIASGTYEMPGANGSIWVYTVDANGNPVGSPVKKQTGAPQPIPSNGGVAYGKQ